MSESPDRAAFERELHGANTRDALSRLSSDGRTELLAFWRARADAELTTALGFEYILEDLREEAAPRVLLDLAAQAIADEHEHADWCAAWVPLLGGTEPAARLRGTRRLSFDGASAHDDRLLRTVFGCCFSETVAVHVLDASLAVTRLPAASLLTRRQLKDEVHHARLGWALLGWDGLAARDRRMIAAHAAELTALTRTVWEPGPAPTEGGLEELGFLSAPLIRAAVEAAIADVIVPGLAHHGV